MRYRTHASRVHVFILFSFLGGFGLLFFYPYFICKKYEIRA